MPDVWQKYLLEYALKGVDSHRCHIVVFGHQVHDPQCSRILVVAVCAEAKVIGLPRFPASGILALLAEKIVGRGPAGADVKAPKIAELRR